MHLVNHHLTERRPLAFYLAMEEWVARNVPAGDWLFTWSVDPTVIIGRNQLLDSEVDTEFCRRHHIDICRRKSGGGAVYADRGNLMVSLICKGSQDNVSETFSRYLTAMTGALRELGLNASSSSRNDILIDGRKVSGNSFCQLSGDVSVVHGTLLHTFDPEMMRGALTPSRQKLESHGVASVSSRVTAISEHLPGLTFRQLERYIVEALTEGRQLTLTAVDVAEIEQIEREYHSPDWLYGKNPRGSLKCNERIDGVGEISLYLSVGGGRIRNISFSGDYFETTDAEDALKDLLAGAEYSPESVRRLLGGLDIGRLIPGMTADRLTKMLF